MTIVLARVDDRLIHGQVVVGWGRPLGAEFMVVVDDGLAASEWEQEIYRSAVPAGIDLEFASLEGGRDALARWNADSRRVFVITGDLATMAALHEAAPGLLPRINLGGIHHRAGRREKLRYLYLDDEESAMVRQLREAGAEVFAQDLPTSVRVGAGELSR